MAAADFHRKMLCITIKSYICQQHYYTFAINGTPLTADDSVRDLGVIENESLTPSTHIAKITATAHQRLNLIFRDLSRVILLCYYALILLM